MTVVDGNSTSAEDPLPLPNVSSEVLTKVLSFIRHHLLHDPPKGERFDDMESTPEAAQEAREAELRAPLEPWDAEFFRMNYHEFCEIILAAQFLQIEQLLQTACKAFALKLKGKR